MADQYPQYESHISSNYFINVIGEGGVGKTSWIRALQKNSPTVESKPLLNSIESQYVAQVVLRTNQGNYNFVMKEYSMSQADQVLAEPEENTIFVSDMTNKESFDNILKCLRENKVEIYDQLIVGTKMDLEAERKIRLNWCGTCPMFKYVEVSNVSRRNIYEPLLEFLRDRFNSKLNFELIGEQKEEVDNISTAWDKEREEKCVRWSSIEEVDSE